MDKVVIDSPFFHALITLGFQENLLDKNHYLYDKYKPKTVSDELKATLFEQLVITPNVISREGRLIEQPFDGDLVQFLDFGEKYPFSDDENLTPKNNIPFDILQGMLKERGYNLSQEEWAKIANEVSICLIEEQEFEKKYGYQSPSAFDISFKEIMENAGVPMAKNTFPEFEIERIKRRNQVYEKFSPAAKCLKDFLSLSYIAEAEGAYLKIPTYNSNGSLNFNDEDIKDDVIFLFRVVASELGQLTFKPTLKDTLNLAKSSESNALREQLQLWATDIANGDITSIGKIKKEIKLALDSLSKRANLNKIGNFTTYLGIPATAAGFVHPMASIASISGVALTLVGVYTTAKVKTLEKKYKWAMFGNK